MASAAWELANWDAVETAERIGRGDVSAAEVVEAALARAEDCKALNAVVTPTPELARARASTTLVGPLAGVPMYTKDLVRVAGVPTRYGTAASQASAAKRSDPIVGKLEARGLISLGKSATPELGLTATTEPSAFGPCHNPRAPGHSPGGSSGGAAALVAAGVVPLAHGSDGGGSVRIPASCCGLVGLKPTRGRLDMEGSNLLPVNIAVHGVLTRTVRDTAAFWGDAAKPPSRRLRVLAFVDSPLGLPVDDELKATVGRTAKALRELGHEVREEACPIPTRVVDDFTSLWAYVAWVQVKGARISVGGPLDATKLEPLTAGFGARFTAHKWRALKDIWRLRGFTAEYAQLFAAKNIDLLLCPTLAQPPPPLGHLSPREPLETAIERLQQFTPFTGLFNSAGAPAISLPLGTSTSGLPLGVMLGALRTQDALLLEVASELEQAMPWKRAISAPG